VSVIVETVKGESRSFIDYLESKHSIIIGTDFITHHDPSCCRTHVFISN
jgi:hypothetical protein